VTIRYGLLRYRQLTWRFNPLATVKLNSRTIRRVCRTLEAEYGRPRLGNPRDPLDDLIYIVLSNKTSPTTARRVFRELKSAFPEWPDLLVATALEVRTILRPAGLSRVKTNQIRAALRRIARDFGACDLAPLRKLPTLDAQAYLCSLPGVSEKVAKCVLLYTLRGKVLPVDAHVHRIAVRLGWTTRKRADQCHEELESIVSPELRFALHVDCIAHGRLICRPDAPLCGECCIRKFCDFHRSGTKR
jgi:endonuclease III